MVFFCVNFSKKVDPEIIKRYIRGIPLPDGVIIFHASPEVIIARLRQRVQEGKLASFHRDIIDTPLLDEWVSKACEVVRTTQACLLDQNIKVYDVNTETEPQRVASNIRELVLSDRAIHKSTPASIRRTAEI